MSCLSVTYQREADAGGETRSCRLADLLPQVRHFFASAISIGTFRDSEIRNGYLKALFPYIGGKHRVARKLIGLMPPHTCFVEVFAGAANVLLNKEPAKAEVLNDANGELVNLYRVVRWHADALLDELTGVLHSHQDFLDYHDQPGLTDIQRAARYFFLLKTTFGGMGPVGHRNFATKTVGRSNLRQSLFETVRQAHGRLDGVIIENLDFEELLRRYDRAHTLFFCDPPYWEVSVRYAVAFGHDDQIRLHRTLRGTKGRFLLTINDHPEVRKLYKGFFFTRLPVFYSVSNDKKVVNELVITNYKPPRKTQ